MSRKQQKGRRQGHAAHEFPQTFMHSVARAADAEMDNVLEQDRIMRALATLRPDAQQ